MVADSRKVAKRNRFSAQHEHKKKNSALHII